jgi:hypothetical protein
MFQLSHGRALLLAPLALILGGAWGDGCNITVEPIEPEDCELACEYGLKHDSDGNAYCECLPGDACTAEEPAPHENPATGDCVTFPTTCDVPEGWEPCGDGTCVVDGVVYAAGDDVPTDEQCTSCRCRADGEVVCLQTPCQPEGCYGPDGNFYQSGERFDAGDGCNTCECYEDGTFGCTEMACLPCEEGDECGCFVDDLYLAPGESVQIDECTWCWCGENGELFCEANDGCYATCVVDGVEYLPGDSFIAPDGCNTCSCDWSGEVYCTEMACTPCEDGADCGCFVDDLYINPGETVQLDECTWCTCGENGELFCEGFDGCYPTCFVDGAEYYPGDTFQSPDGCNTCSCDWSGQVSCTEMACCADENGDGECDATCTYDGIGYAAGDTFPSTDGCNTCGCDSSGYVVCTAMACAELVDCDESNAMCDAMPPICDDGLVPSVVNGCWGACVSPEQCAPKNQCDGIVICAMAPPACGPGEVPVVENGCWGACIPEEDC